MKKIIIAVNNKKILKKIKEKKNKNFCYKKVEYREAILEILENDKKIDLILINEKIPGDISIENLINKINIINNKLNKSNNIIFFLEKENNEKENKLKKLGIENIYVISKIDFKETINLLKEKIMINLKNKKININFTNQKIIVPLKNRLKNKKVFNFIENIIKKNNLINNKLNIMDIIKEKNTINPNNKMKRKINFKNRINEKNKRKNLKYKENKIITVCGKLKSGKSTIINLLLINLIENNKKILLINLNNKIEKNYLILLGKNYKKNKEKKSDYFNFFSGNKSNEICNMKNEINNNNKIKKNNMTNNIKNNAQYKIKKDIKKLEIKVNKNITFLKDISEIFKNEEKENNKNIEKYYKYFFESYIQKYDYILVDIGSIKYDYLEDRIIQNSYKKVIVSRENLFGMQELGKTIKTCKMMDVIEKNSLYIIHNKYYFNIISKLIIKKILGRYCKLYNISYNENYKNLAYKIRKKQKVEIKNSVKNKIKKILK